MGFSPYEERAWASAPVRALLKRAKILPAAIVSPMAAKSEKINFVRILFELLSALVPLFPKEPLRQKP